MGLGVAYEFEDGQLDVELIFVSSGKLKNSELSQSEKVNRSMFSVKRKNRSDFSHRSLSIFVSSVEKITVRSNKKTNVSKQTIISKLLKILLICPNSRYQIEAFSS